MKLEIISFSWGVFKNENVHSLSLITKSWEITILWDHTPLISSVVPCILNVNYKSEDWPMISEDFMVWRWILEVWNDEIKVLIDVLINAENIDIDKAELAKSNALEIMEKYKNASDQIDMEKFLEAEDQLLKALAQLKMAKKNKR